jgi:hypothetical protein
MEGKMDVKIYFLINSLSGGGAESVAIRLTKHLPVDKFILLEQDIKYQLDKHIIFLSNHTTGTNPIYKTLSIPFYAYKLSKTINRGSIVVSFLERANFVNVVSNFFKRHKTIISVRMDQQTGHNGLRKLNKILVKTLYPKADLIVAVSKGVMQSLIELGVDQKKIKVIYNPFPIGNIENLAKEELDE